MDVRLTIGEFSKMTHLSVKALRHYHDVGLLRPAAIDQSTGYRFYDASQVVTAQLIRRLRDLDMPIDDVRTVLDAPDDATRNAAIATHLQRMEERLEQTQATVASLRELLESPVLLPHVDYRFFEPARAIAIRERVNWDDGEAWLTGAFAELDAARVTHTGPRAALYPADLFEYETGDVTAFIPIGDDAVDPTGRIEVLDIPGAHLAVMLHTGSFATIDRTYGALGTAVAMQGIGADGPVRERYLAADRIEVCWPVIPR